MRVSWLLDKDSFVKFTMIRKRTHQLISIMFSFVHRIPPVLMTFILELLPLPLSINTKDYLEEKTKKNERG